jgi:hypothetical protein
MDGQLSFATLDYVGKKKSTKRDVFLAEMGLSVRNLPDFGRSADNQDEVSNKTRPGWGAKGVARARLIRKAEFHYQSHDNFTGARVRPSALAVFMFSTAALSGGGSRLDAPLEPATL